MHSDIDVTRQERLFDLTGEQAFAVNLAQWLIKDLITCDLDHADLERRFGQIKRGHQAAAGLVGLGQRKRGSACANVKWGVGRRYRKSHDMIVSSVNLA